MEEGLRLKMPVTLAYRNLPKEDTAWRSHARPWIAYSTAERVV
jgi:hypothetical protein